MKAAQYTDKKNMSFLDDAEEVKKKFFALDRYMPFIIDEGSKNLHKYQWSSKLQFLLVQMSDTERYQNKAFYVCFPNFKELNSTFRNDRIGMRIYVYSKNTKENYSSAIISIKDVNRYISDPWHTEDNAKLYEEKLKHTPMIQRGAAQILRAEQSLKGYAGNMDIPSLAVLAPRIWDIYMQYKINNARKQNVDGVMEEKESDRTKKWRLNTITLMLFIKQNLPNINNIKLGELVGLTSQKVSELTVNKGKVKELDEIKQKINNFTIE
jgi:hypothetical protein